MKTQLRTIGLGLAGIAMVGLAYADAAKQPMRGPATLKEVMTLVIDPSSAGIFNVASQAPKTDAEWKTLQGQALTLVEIANTLTSAPRAKDKDQWMKLAGALKGESRKAFTAAMSKDVKTLTDLSDSLYETCANCHEKYLPK